MKKKFIAFFSSVLIFNTFLFSFATPLLANGLTNDDLGGLIGEQLAPIEDVYGQEDVDSGTFARAISDVIKIVLGFLGLIFLILILWAGFTWMTSAGNEEKISKAKKMMVAAIIGAAFVLAAYAITYFVIDSLLQATTSSELDVGS